MENEKKMLNIEEKSFSERIAPYLELCARAKAFCYKDSAGRTYVQEPGTYDSRITQAMAHDMLFLAHAGMVRRGEAIRAAESWYLPLKRMDEALMQDVSALKAGQPLAAFSADECLVLMEKMSAVRHEDGLTKEGKRFLDAWFSQVMHMFVFHFALAQEEEMRTAIRTVSSLDCGISERDRETVQTIFAVKRIMLKAMLRLSPEHTGVFELAEDMESLDIAAAAICQGKTKQLSYLLKCAEASEEFKEADDILDC